MGHHETHSAGRPPEHDDVDVVLVPPKPGEWARRFTIATDAVTRALPHVRVEHVGSTAVPDLPAKDVVDVLVGTPPGGVRHAASLLADAARLPGKLTEQTVIAVTTTSSAVTYPTVLRNAVEKVGVSQRVANFTLSLGLTMGSYGAVLNYTIVVLFLAQAGDVQLSTGQILLGMGLAILLNMGTITVPGGFPVVAMFLATTLGLPFEAVGLLIAVDWFTGIFRTFLNVNGDTMVAMLVASSTGEIDREVYDGRRTVEAAEADLDELQPQLARADDAD